MRIRRRTFIIGSAAAVTCSAAAAAPASLQLRMAIAHSGIPANQLAETSRTFWVREFFQELRQLGYIEGRNLTVERYSAEGRYERFAQLARAIVTGKPDVIVTHGPLVNALTAATSTIPIFAIMGDPVGQGHVKSLAHPGANVTGVSVDADVAMYAKQLQILKEAVPSASKIAYLGSEASWGLPARQPGTRGAGWKAPFGLVLREAAPRLGVSLLRAPLTEATPEQIRRAFQDIAHQQADGLIVSPEGEFLANSQLIVE